MFLILVQCRNHSWVSFQGFCESYNDAFNLPRDLGEMNIIYIIVNGYICWIIVAMSVIQNLHLVLWLMLSTLESWKLSWDLLAMLTTVSRKIVTGSCVWRWSKKYDVPVHTLILLWNVHLIANREVLLLYNVQRMHARCYGMITILYIIIIIIIYTLIWLQVVGIYGLLTVYGKMFFPIACFV